MSSKRKRKARKSASAADTPDQARVAAAIDAFTTWAAKNPGAATAAMEAVKGIAQDAPAGSYSGPKRAICLGGGGPAVGLHVGALEGLKGKEIDFGNARSVWALSCIGMSARARRSAPQSGCCQSAHSSLQQRQENCWIAGSAHRTPVVSLFSGLPSAITRHRQHTESILV